MLKPKNLTKKTEQRLTKDLVNLLKQGDFKFDIHTHLFNQKYLPEKYLSIRIPALVDLDFLLSVDNLLDYFSAENDDKLLHYAQFLHFISKNDIYNIAQNLLNYYPANTIFCSLMGDFEVNIEGKKEFDIFRQMNDYKAIRDKYPANFLPFVAIDPNNPLHTEIFNKAFSSEYNFFGVKIYPALGFMPSHPALMKIFEICEKYDIPVVTHSGYGGVYTPKNNFVLEYYDLDDTGKLKLKKQKKNFFFRKQYNKLFGDPALWKPVLAAFPNLRLNIAHFGGYTEWDNKSYNDRGTLYTVIDLMERYPNVYTDVSFIFKEETMPGKFKDLFLNNEIVAKKTLYGSDFPFILTEGDFVQIKQRFISEIGTEIMHKISVENPLKYLNLVNFAKK